MQVIRVGDFRLGWGESLIWDERRERLYFVDCAAQTLHWLDAGSTDLRTVQMPSMPAGIVPTDDPEGRLVGALHDGLHVLDPDRGSTELLAAYPEGMGGRANDVCADLDGNLITGTLNVEPAEGSTWWYSGRDGWRLLDPAISNTNGPAVGVIDGVMTLIVGDTSADYYRYDYDPATGTVGERSVFGAVGPLDGFADGSTLDTDGGLWCALYDGAQLVRFTGDPNPDRTIPVPVANPTDVTFAADRLYVVSTSGSDELDGSLLAIDGLDASPRLEPRFSLT